MTEDEKWKVVNFRRDIPRNMGVVIREIPDSKELVQHGDLCFINVSTGNGNLINTRCVGANSCENSEIFVMWRDGLGLRMRKYEGEPIFPEYFSIF